MSYLNDVVLDSGLSTLTSNGDRLDICDTEPTSYAEATSTYSLGNSAITIGSPGDGTPSGRKVTVGAIAAGEVTVTDTAAYWAITNGTDTLYAVGSLSSPQAVTDGNTFTLAAFDVTIPDPA